MKKIIIIIFAPLFLLFNSCADRLDTFPTDATAPEVVFESVESAATAINGIYRYMYKAGYTTSYQHENYGLPSVFLGQDLMGDDMVRRDVNSAWFAYDHLYWTRTEIFTTSDRPYAWWAFFYKIITSSNYVINKLPALSGDQKTKDYLLGQAYALRAFSYYYLVNTYQLTYFGNEDSPGVPIYTGITDKDTQGKARGKVSDVYTQINTDIGLAIDHLSKGSPQQHRSHIDLYAAYGINARICLMQRDYVNAKKFAELALTKPSLAMMQPAEITGGFNSINNSEWMWGFELIDSQTIGTWTFTYHMDSQYGGYANVEGHAISKWLYDNMDDTDIRKQNWFNPPTTDEVDPVWLSDESVQKTLNNLKATWPDFYSDFWEVQLWENTQNSNYAKNPETGFPYYKNSYIQTKFRCQGAGVHSNDMVYMRAAEMHLIIAEASCLMPTPDYGAAVNALNAIMANKQPGYDASVFPQVNVRTFDTYADDATFTARNILDEVYFQRRVELWGEGFKLFDLSRQKIGTQRLYENSNFLRALSTAASQAKKDQSAENVLLNLVYDKHKWQYTMQIPNSELTNNPEINSADQNPDE